MKIQTIDIIGELERLAAACPWDNVDIWICRKPEGAYRFVAYIRDNGKLGLPGAFGHGASPKEAVDDALKETANRDPEIMREKKIAELCDQIERLQEVVIGLPPYRPNRELAYINVPDTVNV